jgi:plastocyanin
MTTSKIRLAALALVLSVASVARAGEVKGSISFTGTAPDLKPLLVTRDNAACGKSVPDETIEVSKGKLANVVVTVKGAPTQPGTTQVVIDQQKCQYRPHVQAAAAGSGLQIVNSDPVLHNIHGYLGQVTTFNVAMPMKDQKVSKMLNKAGVVRVKCDVHAWMGAFVVVVDGPAAVSGADGAFTIKDVPPGTYTVTAWHEKLGEKTAQLTVPASGAASLDFSFGG